MIRQAAVLAALLCVLPATRAAEAYGAIGMPSVVLGFAQPVSNNITF